jgi:hypothetical protein
VSSSEGLALVLDHSALIPSGDKPEEERWAIRRLGDLLPTTSALWFVTSEYLKTLCSVVDRELRERGSLPQLQRGLLRAKEVLAKLKRDRSRYCRPMPIGKEGWRLGMHMLSRSAARDVGRDEEVRVKLAEVKDRCRLEDDDVEVISIALLAARKASSRLLLVTVDRGIVDAAGEFKDVVSERVGVARPSELLAELG